MIPDDVEIKRDMLLKDSFGEVFLVSCDCGSVVRVDRTQRFIRQHRHMYFLPSPEERIQFIEKGLK